MRIHHLMRIHMPIRRACQRWVLPVPLELSGSGKQELFLHADSFSLL